MAEAIFVREAKALGWNGMVLSMGTHASPGQSVPQKVQEVMREWDLDLSNHLAQPFGPAIARKASHLLVMESFHNSTLLPRLSPGSPTPTLLGSYNDAVSDEIEDPMGGTLEQLRGCRDQIHQAILGFLRWHPPA